MLFRTFKGNAATRYGIEHKMIAIEKLENKINKKNCTIRVDSRFKSAIFSYIS